MPELPEVETVRRDLVAAALGRTIVAAEVTNSRVARRAGDPAALAVELVGRRIEAVARHGKYLLVHLDGAVLVVHLGMSGQLRLVDGDAPLVAHTHARLRFDDRRELRYVDPRTFGELFLTSAETPELARVGPDALTQIDDVAAFVVRVRSRRRQLKDLLMDQTFVAGIGNIYSDEILHGAGLRHDRIGASLSPAAARRLHATIGEVLADAVAHRGSSLADEQYRDLHGQLGAFQHRHRVFAREGEPCGRCGRPILRIRHGGRSHFYCPRCQR